MEGRSMKLGGEKHYSFESSYQYIDRLNGTN